MKKHITLLVLVLFNSAFIFSQSAGTYVFTYTTGTYTPISGTISTAIDDDGAENIALPFSFTYCGALYTSARICTNGWIELGTAYEGSEFGNDLASTTVKPIVAGLWDDLYDDDNSDIQYTTLGAAPDRIFVVQWRNILWYLSGGTAQNFQIFLYETSNVVQIIYGDMNVPAGSPTASIGINDETGGPSHFLSVTPGSTPIVSSIVSNNTINSSTYLTNGLTYTFTPPVACSGNPDPGNTISSHNPVCAGMNFTLSLQNGTPGNDVTYQWQSSPTGEDPWTDVGTSDPSYITFQIVATYYRCQVTCLENIGISNPVLITMYASNLCYCASGALNIDDEEIYSVTLDGITNSFDCYTIAPGIGSILNSYSNFYPLGSLFSIAAGTTIPFTVSENECDGPPFYSFGCGIWIDYNQDGDFDDPSEEVFIESSALIGPRNVTGNFIVPADALSGQTGMRVIVAEDIFGIDLTPCLEYDYGETEDYIVNVLPAPPCLPPTNLTASNISPISADLSFDVPPIEPESFFDVFFGLEGFDPATEGTLVTGIPAPPYTLEGLAPNTSYEWYARSSCMEFSEPKIDYYWLGLNENHQPEEPSGGIANEPGETGIWQLYTTPTGDTWYNIWFYNDPYNPTRMKIIRMGFWVKTLSPLLPTGTISYVVNWSTAGWDTPDPPEPGYPQPDDEAFIARSPVNGPFTVFPAVPEVNPFGQWMELFYVIPEYNPEWVSVDIWGDNIVIMQQPIPPPASSMLSGWFLQDPQPGGMIVHECVPKPTGNVSPWSAPATFTTLEPCPAPTNLATMNITPNSAVLNWDWPIDSFFDVFFGPGSDPFDGIIYTSVTPPFPVTGLEEGANYGWYVRSDCGFEDPKADNFWMAMEEPGILLPPLSGGTFDETGENGTWYLYDQAPGDMDWWNIWFYDDPVDLTKMKKIRMGFWVRSLDGVAPGMLNYVINWSDQAWTGPGFPTPSDEGYIHRSPVNVPIVIAPVGQQWIELYYVIPDYNPEWVSVDIWGENIIIEHLPLPPPPNSPLFAYYNPATMFGGIILHECMPQVSDSTSSWSGPIIFTTPCAIPEILPWADSFEGTWPPDCWTDNELADYGWSQSTYGAPKSGTEWAYCNLDGSELITPGIDLNQDASLVFWYRAESSVHPQDLAVEIGGGVVHQITGAVNTTYQMVQIPLAAYTGLTTSVSFIGQTGTGNLDWGICIDDVSIEPVPFIWTGMLNAEWNNPGNWDRGAVPGPMSYVVIPTDPVSEPNIFPSVANGITATCYYMTLGAGAVVNVAQGGILNVLRP